jgi:hypothetical protein
MFGWVRKSGLKTAAPTMDAATKVLALPNPAFADICAEGIRGEQPGANAMVVVAFKAITLLLPLCAYALEKEGKANRPEDVFRLLFNQVMSGPSDEITRRRYEARFRAIVLHELMQREQNDPSLYEVVVDLWVELAGSAQYIKPLLENNIVWSDDEKSWFKIFDTADDAVSQIVNHLVPARYRSHRKFKELGEKHNFFVVSF